MAWRDDTPGNDEIYYRKSSDGGSSWATKRLTWKTDYSRGPAIAVDSNDHIHVFWHDFYTTSDIYHKKSTDGGSNWISERVTFTGGAWFPAVTVGVGNHIHLVWYDSTPGNDEIYYKKGIQ